MKKTIILSLCALAAFACSKEFAPVSGSEITMVPATIEATIDAPKLGLDNALKLFWEEGDEIRLRTSTATFTDSHNCDLFTATLQGGSLKFTGDLTYAANQNAFLYASKNGIFPVSTSSSQFVYIWQDTQSGNLEDLAEYSVLWGKVDKAVNPITEAGDGTYNIQTSFNPFFCLLKFNIAEGLNVAKVTVGGDSSLGGEVTIYGSRRYDQGFGAGGFALYSSSATLPEFNEITVTREGEELFGDIYVSICPNGYSAESGNMVNTTSTLTLKFYDENDEELGEFSRTLTTPLANGKVKDLGKLTTFEKKEVTEFKPVLTVKKSTEDKSFVPQFIVGAEGDFGEAKYYYETGESLDAIATPTTASAEIPETGVPVDVATAYDIKYVKVLATCPGHDDIYIQAVIRHWLFGKGYTLATSNGLDIPFNPGNPDAAYLSTPAFKANTSTFITAETLMGGNVSLYMKAHAGSNDKTFNLLINSVIVKAIPCSANQYTSAAPGFFVTDGRSAGVGEKCQIEMKTPSGASRNFYVWDYAVIEQQTFTPSATPQAASTIDGLSNGGQYNF